MDDDVEIFKVYPIDIVRPQSQKTPRPKLGEYSHTDRKKSLVVMRNSPIDQLIEIVNLPVKKGENWLSTSSPRNLAILTLGEMRAEQAVPHLVQWLRPREHQIVFSTGRRVPFSPAGFALARIGKPSEAALLNVIATEGNTAAGLGRYAITHILEDIEGKDGAKFVLGNALEAESDPQRQERLGAALRDLEE